MIIRNRPSAIRLFFIVRGSILPRIKWHVLAAVLIAVAVTMAEGRLFGQKVTLTPIPFSLIGLALAIFLGFRNTTSYDRWWEGRRLWGELTMRTRAVARIVLSHVQPEVNGIDDGLRRTVVRRLIAFGYALMHHLRGTDDTDSAAFLSLAEAEAAHTAPNGPDLLLRLISRDIGLVVAQERLDPMMAAELERNVTALAGVQSGSERIRTTPLPFSYTLMLHRTAYLYCLTLPFGLVDSIGLMTPFVVGLISYTFFGLDALGDEIEEPFGLLPNDLPLAALCRRMEIDLLTALGETELPALLEPENYCLM